MRVAALEHGGERGRRRSGAVERCGYAVVLEHVRGGERRGDVVVVESTTAAWSRWSTRAVESAHGSADATVVQ